MACHPYRGPRVVIHRRQFWLFKKDMLPWIEQSSNVRVVHGEALKDRFIGTVQEQALLARDPQVTLILLIQGHGDAKIRGVSRWEKISWTTMQSSEPQRSVFLLHTRQPARPQDATERQPTTSSLKHPHRFRTNASVRT